MKVKFGFHKWYFALTILLFIIEFIIGAEIHDAIIRPYGGDFLVVMLIYCFVKSFLNLPPVATAITVLIFSYAVEISQYFHLVTQLGLQRNRLAKILLGTSFSFNDILAYTLGVITVLLIEHFKNSLKNF